jgi:hypothetical protein
MKNNQLLKGLTIGLGIVGLFVLASFLKKKNGTTTNEPETDADKSIIVGDSQTPFITRQSKKVKMLGSVGGENVLWKGGMGLSWLKGAVSKYPITKDVKNVVINIGTNGGFNINDNVSGLMDELKRVFPNADFYVVKGSWGWGGNKNKTVSQVDNYYQKFKDEGATILKTAIGSVKDPHGNLPIYKEIGKEIDDLL